MSKYKRPSEKRDIVGIFCRTYSCSEAIEKFLSEFFTLDKESGLYVSVVNSSYTLEDDEQQIVWPKDSNTPYNAFDTVRLLKFGEADLCAKDDTPPNRMPSYKSMLQLCKEDAGVRLTIIREKNRPKTDDLDDWQAALTLNDKNEIEKTGQNIRLILLNDNELSKVRFDRFTKQDITESPDFCNERDNRIDDESIGTIALYIESTYGLQLSQPRILEMLKTTSKERGFNPVQEFITAEDWDGKERLETVVIRYLGAEDTPLTRAQTRKWMVGAVARAFSPGCKFDHILTFTGPQGVGKSTFLSSIAGEWFSDSFSFAHDDKAKIEDITGAWIVEISELNGMKRAHDAEAAKAFLSRVRDDVRPAYARKSESIPRSNVFAATTNETEFLQSCNGNRRWWIIPIKGIGQPRLWIDTLKAEVPQLWAEAYTYYYFGENLFLPPELETEANQRQAEYTTAAGDELLEDIEAFLDDDGSLKDFAHIKRFESAMNRATQRMEESSERVENAVKSIPSTIEARFCDEDRNRLDTNFIRLKNLIKLNFPIVIGIGAFVGICIMGSIMVSNSASDKRHGYEQCIKELDRWHQENAEAISFGQFYRENYPKKYREWQTGRWQQDIAYRDSLIRSHSLDRLKRLHSAKN